MSHPIWNSLRHPWLAPLLKQTSLCRLLILAAAIIGGVHLLGYPIPCMFSKLTGLPCAGCGVTRATISLFRGNLSSALHYHPFSPLLFIFGVMISCSALTPQFARHRLVPCIERWENRTHFPTILAVAFLLYGVLRLLGIVPSP